MSNFGPATIPATEMRTVRSSQTSQHYLISVALPFGYEEHLEKNYPVIYVLDSNLFFGMVTDMVRAMNVRVPFCNELPDAVIVGIGYAVEGSLTTTHTQVMHLRMRDFTPQRVIDDEQFIQDFFPVPDPGQSGGASEFLHFIERDLFPLIENAYRVNAADRTLLGHSWGGLFALYSLFQIPGLFQRYVIVSADLPFSNGFILKHEQEYGSRHDDLNVRLYLAAGEPELNDYHLPFLNPFLETLEKRKYAGLQFTWQVFPGCTHCAVVAPAFQAGLVAVFS